ncbi:MAG: formate dehydrogenase accessory protein FdhE [Egibacteraceae bacterium]
MLNRRRGQPGQFAQRLARAQALSGSPTVGEPLRLACAMLAHQRARSSAPTVVAAAALLAAEAEANAAAGRFPLLDVEAVLDPLTAEIEHGVLVLSGQAPAPLAEAGRRLATSPAAAQCELVRAWADDVTVIDPRVGFWVQVGAGPMLELAAAAIPVPGPDRWHGSACPACGGPPQVSVIAERSGEFLGGDPRWLVCGRCATWWGYPRATCSACGEGDPTRLSPFEAAGMPWVRVDACGTCHGYTKTFDLRQDGARDVIPLVDDIASLALDLWAASQGFHRPVRSLAGV